MPFTPFHFGPSAVVGLPLRRYIDLPALLLANVAIDIETLLVMLFNWNYPLHGIAHSFVGGIGLGTVLGLVLAQFKRPLSQVMEGWLGLSYTTSGMKLVLSSIVGCWLHVVLDGLIYPGMRPFYPLTGNPLLTGMGIGTLYLLCGVSFLPAFGIYFGLVWLERRKEEGGRA